MKHCVEFLVFNGDVEQQPNEIQKQYETEFAIKMRKIKKLIIKPFANSFCVLAVKYKHVCVYT